MQPANSNRNLFPVAYAAAIKFGNKTPLYNIAFECWLLTAEENESKDKTVEFVLAREMCQWPEVVSACILDGPIRKCGVAPRELLPKI